MGTHEHTGARELAHELNSLLDGSLRQVRLASRHLGSDPSGSKVLLSLSSAEGAMTRMAELIQRTLGDSDLLENPTLLFRASDRLPHALNQAVQCEAPRASESGIHIHVTVAPELKQTSIGPLGPVLLNTVRNAIDSCCRSMHSGQLPISGHHEVTIRCSRCDGMVRLEVLDTGDGPTRDVVHGNGIGLALSRRILQQMGGGLRLENVPGGAGALLTAWARLDLLNATAGNEAI